MDSNIVESFVEPFLPQDQTFDNAFNEHFANNVLFHHYNPLRHFDMIGFLLAVFSAVKNDQGSVRVPGRVRNVLYGVINDNLGLKSVTLVEDTTNGNQTVIIRNFFFKSNPLDIKSRGLSNSERLLLKTRLTKKFEEKLTEFTIYDMNNGDPGCEDDSMKIIHPFIERIDSIEAITNNEEYGVDEFIELETFPLKAVSSDNLTKKTLRQLVEDIRRVTPKIHMMHNDTESEYLKNGFVHGTLFARAELHKFDVRVYYAHPVKQLQPFVRITVEPKVLLKDFPNFPQPNSLYLMQNDTVKKSDADIISAIIEIFQTNTEQTVEQYIVEYLTAQINILVTFDLKLKNPTYIKAYILGLIFSYDALKTDCLVFSSSDQKFMQVVLVHKDSLLLVFNFDSKAEISIESLKLQEFETFGERLDAVVISVFDILSLCNSKLRRRIIQNIQVSLLKLTRTERSSIENYEPIPETDILSMLLEIHITEEKIVPKIFDEFTQLFLDVVKIGHHNQAAFGDFLEGILHNIVEYAELTFASYKLQIDKFHIDAGTFCLRIQSNDRATEINFMTVDFVNLYLQEKMVYFQIAKNSEHRFLSFFYNFDPDSASTAVRGYYMSQGYPELDYAACHDASKKPISCTPKLINSDTSLEKNKCLPEPCRRHVSELLGEDVRKTPSLLSRKKRSITPSFDVKLIETLYNGHWTDDEVDYHGYNNLREHIHQKLGLNANSIAADILVTYARSNPWLTGLYSKMIGDQDLTPNELSYGQEIEKVDNVLRLSNYEKLCIVTRKFFAMSKSVQLQKEVDSKLWNTERMNNAVYLLEKEPDIRAVVTSAGCFNLGFNVPCEKIVINFRRPYYYVQESDVSRTNPDIPANYSNKYGQNCKVIAGDSGEWIESDRKIKTIKRLEYKPYLRRLKFFPNALPTGIRNTFGCGDAFEIGRKNRTGNTILYKLDGNSVVYAAVSPANFFILSGDDYCTIIGGGQQNFVKFKSFFKRGYIDFSDGIANVVDFSSIIDSRYCKMIFRNFSVQVEHVYGSVFAAIHLININKLVLGRQNVADDIIIDCLKNLDTIEVKSTTRCERNYLHEVTITECPAGNLHILLNGCVMVQNLNWNRNFTYKINSLTNDVRIRLITSASAKHTIDMTLINITNLDKIDLVRHFETQYDIIFAHENGTFFVQIHDKFEKGFTSEPLLILFQDGMSISFWNNTLQTSIYFPKSKGQLWLKFRKMLQLFSKANFLIHAFSERDRERFDLANGKIIINGRRSLFSVSANDDTDTFECSAGYNIFLISLPLCEMKKPTRLERGFGALVIRSSPAMDVLILDLTPVTDYVSEISLNSSLKITPSVVERMLNLSIETSHLPMKQYRLGTILLPDILSNDSYKKVTIKEKWDFTLYLDQYGNIRLKPQAQIIAPLQPIVILNENLVEEHQDLLFVNRSLINYDLIEINNSTLVISNAAIDVMKSLVLTSLSQPLHTIIVKNFDTHKMRSLILKFDYNVEIDLSNLNTNKIITLSVFQQKIEKIADRLSQRAFLLRKDTRFRET